MSKDQPVLELRQKITELEREIREASDRLPAHSIRPHQLIAIEEMEDELENLKAELSSLLKSK